MSEEILKVGKKGEIFTNKELRIKAKIKEGGKVKATMINSKLVIEPIPSIEELLHKPVFTIGTEAEGLSEEAQREEGIYG
jgi:bifunctional DNA-binding transcriptional regulator/antitoxin component of YhaV-PrlF toxin-antitoxin module